jgi:hypothetical protein
MNNSPICKKKHKEKIKKKKNRMINPDRNNKSGQAQ